MSSVPESSRPRREVSPSELFYDLAFVFAVSQLSHHLLEHLTWRGAAETGVLLVAVFGTWAYTSYEATLLDVHRDVTRWMIVIVMGLGLFMNATIPGAFDDRAWAFVIPLLAILFFAGAVTALAGRTDALREHFRRTLVWMAVSAPLWIIGAAAGSGPRLWWWAVAALIDLTGTWLAHPLPGRTLSSRELAFDADHMLERLRLFFIILLGETVLTAGRTLSEAPVDVPNVLATAAVFTALVCLWAAYFGGGEDVVTGSVANSPDPVRSVRLGVNSAYLVLAALVALAVGSELAIAHPTGHGSTSLALLLFGGPALYLATTAWFFGTTAGGAWKERLLAAAVLAAAGVVAVRLPPLASLAVLDLILVVTATVLTRAHRRLTSKQRDSQTRLTATTF
ncbi:low temperature requirement protein A [Streptomyces acidiscabies]|uniref:low temperature requirement protein A n=1 Tax=Streptomyces acidiscabies TaxID=42234 RepID=UPI00073E1ABC|nr:low temperature requirement protein A [Streptomyces acidiscabies]GAQ54712.1 bacterial low temperature requirement A protein [Streptomyces acidiscabies]